MLLRREKLDLFPDERSYVPVVSSGRAAATLTLTLTLSGGQVIGGQVGNRGTSNRGTGNRGTMKAASATSPTPLPLLRFIDSPNSVIYQVCWTFAAQRAGDLLTGHHLHS